MYRFGVKHIGDFLQRVQETPDGVYHIGDPNVDELNATTLYEIYPKVIEDQYFLAAPFLAYLRDHCLVPFTGGAFTQAMFRYAPLIGGFYAPGIGGFNITKRQTIGAVQFDTRYSYVSIPEYKEQIQVENKGELAVASLLDADMQNGVDTINEIYALAIHQSGQGARALAVNGWVEALNDGITPGWDGVVYTSYGGQLRNGVVGGALNSIPVYFGDSEGNPGPILYAGLEEMYQDASIGKKEPNLICANKACIAYMKEKLVVQQRFQQERDPVWGVMGFRFNNAMVLKDDYFPSLKYGLSNRAGGQSNLTGTFVSPGTTANGGTADPTSNLPAAGKVVTVGEVLVMLNTFDFLFRVTDNEEYGFGWSGFVPAQDNTRVVGQIKAECNLENISPRTSKQGYGIGG
jgi:hypothetical protein